MTCCVTMINGPIVTRPSAHPRAAGFFKDSFSRGLCWSCSQPTKWCSHSRVCQLPSIRSHNRIEITPSVECSRESWITLIQQTACSVHTLALPVRLDHWIRCHFLYTNAKKSEIICYWYLIVAKKKKKTAFCTVYVDTTCPCTSMWMQFILTMVVRKAVSEAASSLIPVAESTASCAQTQPTLPKPPPFLSNK